MGKEPTNGVLEKVNDEEDNRKFAGMVTAEEVASTGFR